MPASAGKRVLGGNLYSGAGITSLAITIYHLTRQPDLSGWARSVDFSTSFERAGPRSGSIRRTARGPGRTQGMAGGSMQNVIRNLRKLVGPPPADETSDAQLLERFALHRDEAAFEALVQR